MLLGDLLGKPLVIDGKEIILVDDRISDIGVVGAEIDTLVEIEPPDGVSPGFYISEPSLVAIRTSYPDHTMYGLWQTLYHSGMLSGAEFVFLPFNENSGRYAQLEKQGDTWVPVISDVVTGGTLADGITEVTDVYRLDVDPSLLVLPDEQAMLHRERIAMIQQRSRRRYWQTAVVVGVIAVVGAIYEGAMMLSHSSQVSVIEDLRAEQRSLNERIGTLTRTRLLNEPDYNQTLERIFHLHTIDPGLETAQASRFDDDVILLLSRDTLPFLKTIDWVVPEITDDGGVAVVLSGE